MARTVGVANPVHARRYNSLPRLSFPGDPDGYPNRDEVIGYLEQYAETLELPIELNSPVRRLTAEGGRFVLEVDGRTITSDQVVVATGPFQAPFVPELADRLGAEVFRAHSTGYRKPSDVPEGTVLIVGGGNTGSRSRRSPRRHTGFSSRSALARHHCRSGSSAATSSGG
jgi:putative flavoprotein involved in K+ transport